MSEEGLDSVLGIFVPFLGFEGRQNTFIVWDSKLFKLLKAIPPSFFSRDTLMFKVSDVGFILFP